jgi:hypothetical protein
MKMNNRREFLAGGGVLAAMAAMAEKAEADQPKAFSVYLHGMVWNRQLPAPMNDWLIRFDARADIPIGNAPPPTVPGFGTLGDDFHTGVGSHVAFQSAQIQGDMLTINGTISESNTAGLVGQAVKIQGKVVGTAVEGLTITIGDSVFSGAGLVVIAIIAILIG